MGKDGGSSSSSSGGKKKKKLYVTGGYGAIVHPPPTYPYYNPYDQQYVAYYNQPYPGPLPPPGYGAPPPGYPPPPVGFPPAGAPPPVGFPPGAPPPVAFPPGGPPPVGFPPGTSFHGGPPVGAPPPVGMPPGPGYPPNPVYPPANMHQAPPPQAGPPPPVPYDPMHTQIAASHTAQPAPPPAHLPPAEIDATKTSRPPSAQSASAPAPAGHSRAVVIDNGSSLCKLGFAGEASPRVVFPSLVGRPRHVGVMQAMGNKDTYVGSEAQQKRGMLTLAYPMQHGVVMSWDDMERVWHHGLFSELRLQSAEDYPVLLTEAPLNPLKDRETMAQIFFEKYRVSAVYVVNTAAAALYGTGRTSGLVVDIGDGVTFASPVWEAYTLDTAVRRLDLGGRDVTEFLTTLLARAGYDFSTTALREVVADIKEKLCYVALDYALEMKAAAAAPGADYVMPDGQKLHLSQDVLFTAPEALFAPSLIGKEANGVAALAAESINSVDINLRRMLFGSVTLSGGSSLFKNMRERMAAELRRFAPTGVDVDVTVPPDDRRRYLVWYGASMLAASPQFGGMWITRKEFQERGPSCIHGRPFQGRH